MKALTIWQPWASLIAHGAKPYEFRGWYAHGSMIGQRIVIHAAARAIVAREVDQLIKLLDAGGRYAAQTCLIAEKALPILKLARAGELPLSAGLGTAVLGRPRNGIEVAEEFGVPRANDSDRKQHANWAWPMEMVETWPEPIHARGAQGFWPWPTPESTGLV